MIFTATWKTSSSIYQVHLMDVKPSYLPSKMPEFLSKFLNHFLCGTTAPAPHCWSVIQALHLGVKSYLRVHIPRSRSLKGNTAFPPCALLFPCFFPVTPLLHCPTLCSPPPPLCSHRLTAPPWERRAAGCLWTFLGNRGSC